jgi:hypothetical protein
MYPLNVHDSVAFSIFTKLCSQSSIVFSLPLPPYPVLTNPFPFLPPHSYALVFKVATCDRDWVTREMIHVGPFTVNWFGQRCCVRWVSWRKIKYGQSCGEIKKSKDGGEAACGGIIAPLKIHTLGMRFIQTPGVRLVICLCSIFASSTNHSLVLLCVCVCVFGRGVRQKRTAG